MSRPTFLQLPSRSSKPRSTGLTHVLDKGMPLGELEGFLDSTGDLIDVWKFGWGTAYIDPMVEKNSTIMSQAILGKLRTSTSSEAITSKMQ